jgi:signal transduction histidine kinase
MLEMPLNPTMIIFFSTLIINAVLLCVIIFKKWKEFWNPIYLYFVLSIFSLLLWTVFNYLADTTISHSDALFYTQATIPSAFLMCWFIFLFSCFFPIHVQTKRNWSFVYFAFVAMFSVCAMMGMVIKNVTIDPPVGVINVENTILFIPVVILYIVIFGHALVNLYRKYFTLLGSKKEQVRYVLLGWALFLIGGIIVSGIMPLFGNASLSKIGPLFSVCMVGLTTYAILRHQFFDIRLILQRGLIYFIFLGTIIIFYVASIEFIGDLVREISDSAAIVSAGVTMIVGILFFRPVERYFRKITDPFFFKDHYNYADALHELSNVLYENVNHIDIINASSEVLKRIFKTNDVTFCFTNEKITSSSDDETLCIPIIANKNLIGTVCLGHKLSGDRYTKRDRKLLETFVLQAAVALEKGRLYEKVEKYNTHLEQLVEERTKEIKDVQEDQKQVMIDISHNLQTPLAVIIGELELLDDMVVEKEKVTAVVKSIDRVSGFIRQLLHLARLDHATYMIDISAIDLSHLLEEQVEYFDVMASEKNVHVISKIESDISILGNKRLLDEVFINLVVNAINYREPSRRSTLLIRLQSTDTSAVISFEDNGIGIASHELSHIFTRFYKGSQRRSSGTPSTGLGLAICKKIIEKHNGSIECTSIVGEKTCFTITIPLLEKK